MSRQLLFAKGANEALPVAPKSIAALLLFIESRGELLTKDQLMAGLWPGRVVEENNLTQLISVLRHVLGEEPGAENRHIATVPGRGYRFIPDVMTHPDPAEPPARPREIAPTIHTRPRRVVVVALAGALGAVLLTYGWYAHWPAGGRGVSASGNRAPVAHGRRPALREPERRRRQRVHGLRHGGERAASAGQRDGS